MAVSVSSFAELKTAIEDSSTTEIIATNDITYSGGIKVNVAKPSIVIDFGGFNVYDNNNQSLSDTIYVPSTTNNISVTVKNAIFSGKNYYGIVGVNSGNTNTTIELVDITYTGPQFVYNKNGITKINNCTVTLSKNESSTNPQEFCEANRLFISGKVNVISESTTDSTIWFTGTNASLTVEEGAQFYVNASSTYFLYTDVSPDLLFKAKSSTTIYTNKGLFYASGSSTHIAKSFTLEENASFVAYKTQSNSIPMFKCLSNFTLNENSTFNLYSEVISSTALMYFGQTANININSPKNVVLYNRGGNVLSFATGSQSSPNKININAEMLRLWNVALYPLEDASANTPTSEYYKKDYSQNLSLQATASSSAILTAENNLESGDTGYPITTAIKLISSCVVSMGTIPLIVNEINDKTTMISGSTFPQSNMTVEINGKSETFLSKANGSFGYSLTDTLSAGDSIKITTNRQFLTKTLSFDIDGTLSITTLPPLKFLSITKNPSQDLILRQNDDYSIVVTDTRLSGGDWYLYAYISQPLSSNNSNLEDALIFKSNNTTSILSKTPILIYSGKWNENQKTTTISWNSVEGLLLSLDKNQTYESGNYKTQIMWQLSTTPLDS